jgi:hypothetical protein
MLASAVQKSAGSTATMDAMLSGAAAPARKRCCRFCDAPLDRVVVDLGMSPLANSYLRSDDLHKPEHFYPLRVYVCEQCLLVQLEEWESPKQIFSDYAYFSSFSNSWLEHARKYVSEARSRFHLDKTSQVIEIASNDGYLLQYFVERGVPVLGIEPAQNVAEVARRRGIETLSAFFGESTARDLARGGVRADLLVGNNVLAHVPNINDFVRGLKVLLADHGVITMEFPHLMQLMAGNQIDTIYHEHFSYFSFLAVERIFAAHGLIVFDVDELPTHGGSLRIYAGHVENESLVPERRVADLRDREAKAGLGNLDHYLTFGDQAVEIKRKLLELLIAVKRAGSRIAGYGAPAKGNTLLNFCGVRSDFIDYTVDRSPYKQGLFLPGTRIRIDSPERIKSTRPDYLLILPWNLKDEIMAQMSFIREWGGQFIVPIPDPRIIR